MSEFTLLRPWWLFGLLPVAWLCLYLLRRAAVAGAWSAWVDPRLAAYVLTDPGRPGRRLVAGAVAVAGVLAVIALAGPAWERLPQPVYRGDSALVVVLDLSRSMGARDVAPSRLDRARLKVRDILARRPADQLGLVVYSANAFVVTPLTTDMRNVELLLAELTPDIMPSQGSLPSLGLRKGAELILQSGARGGELLLITDDAGGVPARDAAADLARLGIRTSVLAVGTSQGGPVVLPDGSLLRDSRAQIVVPVLQEGPLRRLAAEGGGRFAVLSPDDGDLEHLLAPLEGRVVRGDSDRDRLTEGWLDRGPWLVLALLPLALLAFRRGVVAGLLVVVLLPAAPAFADAERGWRPGADHRAYQRLEAGDAEAAAEGFVDPEWRAAALYRAGRHAESAAALEPLDSPRAHYNRGNALARDGRLLAALEAWDRTLELDPAHDDARYNRDLVRRVLEEAAGDQAAGEGEANSRPGESPQEGQSGADAGAERGEDRGEEGAEDGGEGAEDAGEDGLTGAGGFGADATEGDEPPPPDRQAALEPGDVEAMEAERSLEGLLRQVPDDPGALLRRKFEFQYRREQRDQDGNPTWPGDVQQPW
jgi:Ca-activated chloride channel homolog